MREETAAPVVSPRLFRRILVDGNGGEMEIKANRLRNGEFHVFVVQFEGGRRIDNSKTKVHSDKESATAEAERIQADLLALGWRLKNQRVRTTGFELDNLPAPKVTTPDAVA